MSVFLLFAILFQITPELLPVVASLVPVVKHLFAGVGRTDYPPIIDEEIDILLNSKLQKKDSNSKTDEKYEQFNGSMGEKVGKNRKERTRLKV